MKLADKIIIILVVVTMGALALAYYAGYERGKIEIVLMKLKGGGSLWTS